MRGLPSRIAGALAAILAGTLVAGACEGDKVLFQDNFDSFESTWGKSNNELFVENGEFFIKPKANFTLWAPNTASIYEDVDVCAKAKTVDPVDAGNSFVGIIYWYVDDDNYYSFEIDGDGYASVWRRQNGRWLSQVDWVESSLLNSGNGSVNEIRVVTNGKIASYYINGELFREGMGVPPDVQQVGIIASSPKEAVATYSFDEFVVTEPQK